MGVKKIKLEKFTLLPQVDYHELPLENPKNSVVVHNRTPHFVAEVMKDAEGKYIAKQVTSLSTPVKKELLDALAQWYFFRYVNTKTKLPQ